MSNLLDRLQSLSGLNPQQIAVDRLIAEQAEINKAYENAIVAAKRNEPINEGLFSSLKIALGTAGNMTKSTGGAVASKVKALASSVKELYKDAKATAELAQLIKEMNGIIKDFGDIEKAAPTILSKDPAIKKSIDLFGALMKKTVEELSARQASSKGITEQADIDKMMNEVIQESLPGMDVERIYDMLMSASFESWYEKEFMNHVEDPTGPTTKKQILEDIKDMLS